MRRTGTITAIVVALLALAGTVVAGPHHRGMHGAAMMDRLADELELSTEQRETVKSAMESRRGRMQALHAELRSNHEQMRGLDPADPNYETLVAGLAQRQGELTTEMALLRSRAHAELMAVLTDEQKARFSELAEQRRARRMERHERFHEFHGRGPEPGDEAL